MDLITRDELVAKLDDGDDFRLVMVLGAFAFQAGHIPGSLHVATPQDALQLLDSTDDIVVYCANDRCLASIHAYHHLTRNGYASVRRYAGGLEDWVAGGHPLEGNCPYA